MSYHNRRYNTLIQHYNSPLTLGLFDNFLFFTLSYIYGVIERCIFNLTKKKCVGTKLNRFVYSLCNFHVENL